jgi:hypothetical protein
VVVGTIGPNAGHPQQPAPRDLDRDPIRRRLSAQPVPALLEGFAAAQDTTVLSDIRARRECLPHCAATPARISPLRKGEAFASSVARFEKL